MPLPLDANPIALWAVLSPTQGDLLRAAAGAARETGGEAYLVGGPVRDLLLGATDLTDLTDLHDLDLMTTVDARVVAAEFARRVGGAVEKTTVFGTATVAAPTTDGATSLDFATTRTEMYPHPGALPVTAFPAPTVDNDLKRRDFTINAMALPLIGEARDVPAAFGPLLDPFGGLHDLRAGVIRVLHDASFRDDPTRLFRGARYAARYGYTLEPYTATLAETAVRDRYLTTISPARKRREIEAGMREDDATRCLNAFAALGLLQATSPALIWNDQTAARVTALTVQRVHQRNAVEASTSALWPLWAAFAVREGEPAAEVTARRLFTDLAITETAAQAPIRLLAHASDAWQKGEITPDTPNSALASYFEKLPEPVATVFFPSLVTRLHALYARLDAHGAAPHLRGDELHTRFGVPQGPAIGKMLGDLHAAWLDRHIETLEDEKGFVAARVTE